MPTIYIFDYDEDITYILCDWFQSHGYEVKGFSTDEQLLKQLSISHPDCIILDTFYGKLSSTLNICHAIQNVLQFTGKIVLTSTSNLTASDVKLCNASHFIAKPFKLSEVLMAVNRLLISSKNKTIIENSNHPNVINKEKSLR